MGPIRSAAYSLLVAAVFVVASQAASESSSLQRVAPSLAKAKLSEATAAAKAWRPDAFLIQVAGRSIGDDGLNILWDYGYYSPTAKTCLVVNVGGAGASKTESGGPICAEPELKDFMDSDRAMKIARTNGITAPKVSMIVSTSARGNFPLWIVMDGAGMKTGDATVEINALTGAVVGKSKMP